MTTLTAAAPVDMESGLARLGGDREFYSELLSLFVEQARGQLEEMKQLLDGGDLVGLSQVAHSIKGAAANLSAEPARHLAENLEHDSRSGRAEGLSELLETLETEVGKVEEFCCTMA